MGDDVQSIEDLIMASRGDTVGDDQSAQAKFQAKQKEIKAKETERSTQTKARDMGVPYINLFGFPVSPEALVLIPEERARQLNVVCFFYDGRNVRLGATHPEVPEIKAIAAGLREKQHSLVEIYLISSNSFQF